MVQPPAPAECMEEVLDTVTDTDVVEVDEGGRERQKTDID